MKRRSDREGVSRWYVTPLFVALLTIEISDIIFAILGLRALYFAVDGMIEQFHYLKYGLAIILMFVGVKLLLMDVVEIKTFYSLLFIVMTITTSIVISVRATKRKLPASHVEQH